MTVQIRFWIAPESVVVLLLQTAKVCVEAIRLLTVTECAVVRHAPIARESVAETIPMTAQEPAVETTSSITTGNVFLSLPATTTTATVALIPPITVSRVDRYYSGRWVLATLRP